MAAGRNFKFLGEVAMELHQPFWRIRYAVTSGRVKAPPVVRGRMLFSAADVEALRAHFGRGGKAVERSCAQRANATTN